jgi:hypothetical protein
LPLLSGSSPIFSIHTLEPSIVPTHQVFPWQESADETCEDLFTIQ